MNKDSKGAVYVVSLGCAKNLTDTEQMLFLLKEAGYTLTSDPETADAALVNTCGFLQSAKTEAIETILELSPLRERGRLRAIVAAGCMCERHKDELFENLPEISAYVTPSTLDKVVEAMDNALKGKRFSASGDINAPVPERERFVSTPSHFAYVRISEGCDNRCGYCAIPLIRGRLRSRKMEDILAECRTLVDKGTKELIFIAQDTTSYGVDLYGERKLAELLRRVCKIENLSWLRLHYLYPDGFSDELIDLIAIEPKILKYLDIPVQHISDHILSSMNRRYTGGEARALIKKLRERIPGVVLRTSLIAGLPGETREDFLELKEFLKLAKFERAGVFVYSPEEGTLAANMENQVPKRTAERRAARLTELQQEIMNGFEQSLLGKTFEVLCEGFEDNLYFGRSFADSPDVDGRVFFTCGHEVKPGGFVSVLITHSEGCDLTGEAVEI